MKPQSFISELLFGLPATSSPEGAVNTIDKWKSVRLTLVSAAAYLTVTGLQLLLDGITSGSIDLGAYVGLKEILSLGLGYLLELARRRFSVAPKKD